MIFSFLVVFIFYLIDFDNNVSMYNEYKEVVLNDSLAGVLVKKKHWKGSSFLIINKQKKYFVNSRNYMYSPRSLDSFVRIGDSLIKKRGSDTLHIIRYEKTYYFILGENINKNK